MLRELDAAIAEALGYEVKIEKYSFGEYYIATNKTWDGYCPSCGYDGLWSEKEVPDYSTDGNAMLELDREMRERGWQRLEQLVMADGEPVYHVLYWTGEHSAWDRYFIAETNPLARALAAYKALTGKEWKVGSQ